MSEEVVVVVAGGVEPRHGKTSHAIRTGTPVVAADGGLERARALGLDVTIAIGDFDSASSETVREAEASGTRLERHPTAKDATDLELALDRALELHPQRIVVLAVVGDRLDHLYSTFQLLASPRYAEVELDADIGLARVHVIRGERTLSGRPGELLSLFAVQGPAEGVRTDGLAYPLDGETLDPGSSRGVSNVFVEATATISVGTGVLLAIRPGVET